MAHQTVIVKRQLEPGSTPFAIERTSTSLADYPYNDHLAPIAVFNGQGSGKILNIKLLNTRPQTGSQSPSSLIQFLRIASVTGGSDLTPIKLDSNNADLPSQVRAAFDCDVSSSGIIRRDFICSGANFTRTLANLTSMLNGDSRTGLDTGEFVRYSGDDLDLQKIVLREGEGVAVLFEVNGPTFCFGISAILRNQTTGECYRFNDMIEPRFLANDVPWALINGAGSGIVLEVDRLQIRELGTDEVPIISYEPIDGIDWASEDAIYVLADTGVPLAPEIYIKKNCVTSRAGSKYGGLITNPAYRRVSLAEPPWGPNISGGPQVARRGTLSPDMDTRGEAPITLREGQGIALFIRNASAQLYHEFTATITIEDAYPTPAEIAEAVWNRTGRTLT